MLSLVRGVCLVAPVASLAVPGPLSVPVDAYMAALQAHPLQTNLASAATLAFAGDAIAQRVGKAPYDPRRAVSFVTFDAAYRGGFQTAALPWIIDKCDGHVLESLCGPVIDQSVLAATEATLFNQLLVIPIIYYPLFYAITGPMQGLTQDESIERARSQFVPITIRNWKFWIPANFAQFVLLEEQYQVPYTCVMGLIWNVILSASAGAARPAVASAASATDAASTTVGRVVPVDSAKVEKAKQKTR